ncbi:MAG: YoaK family protein [Bacteriovoracia bacterium]
MYRLEREEFVRFPFVFLWILLAFQAGFINAFGFLACGRYVSHVTGFGTQIGVALAQKKPFFALELVGFPVFFILGSFVSGLITAARIESGRRPRFDLVTVILPVLILLLFILGHRGAFGPFGEDLIQARDFFLLFLLSFICGMQNSCFAVLTKGQIRTTHLTGISTDIGTDLARTFFGNLGPIELELTKRTNTSRIVTFVFFAIGSVFSVHVSQYLEHLALVVPLLTSLIVLVGVQMISRKLDRKYNPQMSARE